MTLSAENAKSFERCFAAPIWRSTYNEHSEGLNMLLNLVREEERERAKQRSTRFTIGDPVKVIHDFRRGEWVGLPLFVVGIAYEAARGLNYSVSESWPPKTNYEVTDGFREEDLTPRARVAP